MKKPVQSFSRLAKDVGISLVSTSVLYALSLLRLDWKIALAVFGIIPIYIYFRYQRFFKMMTTSTLGYYYSFDSDDNLNVYREAREKLCYLGISANSIVEYLRHWAEEHAFPGRCRFLLMDPDNMDALIEQQRFEMGICLGEDTPVDESVARQLRERAGIEADRIRSAIEVLKKIDGLEGKIEIRLYGEFIPWWMYLVDDRKIYMGILKAGRRGQDASVMTLKKNEDFPSPFEPIKYKWDSLWRTARRA